jgi:hypothetical protein
MILVWETFSFFIVINFYFFYLILMRYWHCIWFKIRSHQTSLVQQLQLFLLFVIFLFNYFILLLQQHLIYGGMTLIHVYMWVYTLNLMLTFAFPLTPVFVWRWTHTQGHWIISSMTSILKIVLWMFQKMCISEFDILFVIYFYLLIFEYL